MVCNNESNGGTPVLIVGSIALDTVKTPLGEVNEALGGAAVYSSVAASFFTPVQIVGVVGQDFPKEHLSFLSGRGIDTAGVQMVSGKSFRWSGYYEFDLNHAHTLNTELNVFETFRPHIPDAYRNANYVFLANIDPDLQLQVLDQVEKPKLTACDTMNFWITNKKDTLKEVLKRVDVVFMNDAEARQFCDCASLVKAAGMIREMGPSVVVIKKGEHGALMFTNGVYFAAPSYPLEDIYDPTGAGDSFAGGFMGYLAHVDSIDERSMRRAVVYGSTMASYNVQDFSLRRFSTLDQKEISDRYNEFKEISFFDELG